MLRMMKYEYRRNLTSLLCVLGVLIALEVLFGVGLLTDKGEMCAIAIVLLVITAFTGYIVVLVLGLDSLNKDLKNKYGYMVFMTPISSYEIIGAKLLSILLSGLTIVAAIFVCLILNIKAYLVSTDMYSYTSVIDVILEMLGIEKGVVIANIFLFVLLFLIMFYTGIVTAFFATAISSTLLQNKKFKGLVSVIIFIVLNIVISKIGLALAGESNMNFSDSTFNMSAIISNNIKSIIYYACIIIAGVFGTGYLLDKKISL